jgi:MoaA/NifB/PqqE/SkfB family radical SAM enzyme
VSLVDVIRRVIPQSELRQSLSAARTSLNDLSARKVRTVQIYTTNRCNSRCVHCFIWKYTNNMDLPVETIAKILQSECLAPANDICLEGGEFTLHPAYKEILSLFKDRQVCVISNGILTSRIADMVETSPISKLMISLDGTRETYLRVRGLDVYERVIETIKTVKDKVKVALNFTITPWNDARDYEHVKQVAEELGLELGLPNIYTTQPYFKTVDPPGMIRGKHEAVPTRDVFQRRYLDYHDQWLRGGLTLPCLSIFRSAIVYPEGDVAFCHQRVEIVGNLHRHSLDEIWTSDHTRRMQDKYLHCNKCWCTPHRLQDVYSERLGKAILLKERVSNYLRGE